jgi:exopolysaccharide biosynthesis protein
MDPSQLGVFAPVSSGLQGISVPVAASDVIGASGALAAINGPYFDTASNDTANYNDTPYDTLLTRHYDPSTGVNATGTHPSDGSTISVVNGRAVITPGSSIPDGATVAIQGWPTLLANAQTQALTNLDAALRSALAILWNGQLAFVISNSAMTLSDFARAIANELGATDAINLDGGGSTALVFPEVKYGSGANRRVASWLIMRPASNLGSILPVLSVVALAVGGWLLWKNSERS